MLIRRATRHQDVSRILPLPDLEAARPIFRSHQPNFHGATSAGAIRSGQVHTTDALDEAELTVERMFVQRVSVMSPKVT
jgi:hypothetical protein